MLTFWWKNESYQQCFQHQKWCSECWLGPQNVALGEGQWSKNLQPSRTLTLPRTKGLNLVKVQTIGGLQGPEFVSEIQEKKEAFWWSKTFTLGGFTWCNMFHVLDLQQLLALVKKVISPKTKWLEKWRDSGLISHLKWKVQRWMELQNKTERNAPRECCTKKCCREKCTKRTKVQETSAWMMHEENEGARNMSQRNARIEWRQEKLVHEKHTKRMLQVKTRQREMHEENSSQDEWSCKTNGTS